MFFEVYLFLGLLVIGYIIGQFLETRHFKSINEREQGFLSLVAVNGREPVGNVPNITHTELVMGSCCISIDYFKRIVTGLRKLFGGNIRGYETLLDRARREAILRLKESCPGAAQVINLRIETSSITKGQAQQTACVEVLAYGTAIYTTGNSESSPAPGLSFAQTSASEHSSTPSSQQALAPDNKPARTLSPFGKGREIDRDP